MKELMTSDGKLFRAAGVAAAGGGLLRLATAIPGVLRGHEASERAYFTVDLLALISLFALFASQERLRRGVGPWGFGVAVLGLILIRTGTRIGAFAIYEFAAAVLMVGSALMDAAILRSGRLAAATGGAWIASLVVGVAGALTHIQGGFLVASVLFSLGLGFAAAVLFTHNPRKST